MRYVLTVSLNAAAGLTYQVDGFALGRVNQVQAVSRTAEGKANNVARVLAGLGRAVTATGFAGGVAGEAIQTNLKAHGIAVEYLAITGENRTCISLVNTAGQELTEIHETGPVLSEADADRFFDRYCQLLAGAEAVVISGSLPPGIPTDFYGRLNREAWRRTQVRTFLDAAGEALRQALPAQPYLVKPNLAELQEWAGRPLSTEDAILIAAREMLQAGPLIVAVSLGSRGLLMVSPEGIWRATPPAVEMVNHVGSGDALVAGLVTGLLDGLSAEEILQLAVGCGTANVLTLGVAEVRQEDVAWIRPRVRVERLE